jgi:TatA/E family protein of Tat protein translocase
VLNLDPAKLLIIAVVAIILLGPDKLPHVARQIGGTWRSFNNFRQRMESEVRSTMPDLPSTADISRLARSPSALLNHISNMSPEAESSERASTEMSWVTADYSTETGSLTTDPHPQHPGESVVAGDASLN